MAVVNKSAMAAVLAAGLMGAASVQAEEAWHWNLGVGASVIYHSNSGGSQSEEFSDTTVRPNIQVGIVRPISERWTMGTGLELVADDVVSWGNSGNLLMWRIGEFTYQLSEDWALSFYGGAGRYYRETNGYGYGLGAGAHYRLSSSWELSVELSYVGTDTSINKAVPFKRDKFGWGSTMLRYRF
ncbi:outer membrane beta-barrel protein [Marinobacter hydrocarbonoclasticus]|nr:outer membrane beta-barrel protein [Marinobacter nauticus]